MCVNMIMLYLPLCVHALTGYYTTIIKEFSLIIILLNILVYKVWDMCKYNVGFETLYVIVFA